MTSGSGASGCSGASDPTHYERLGVAEDASPGEIRDAYRRLARRLHPDTGASTDAEMAALNEAWFVLRDPGRRVVYDRSLVPPADRGTPPSSSPSHDAVEIGAHGSGPGSVRVVRGLPWLIVLAVLAAIFLFTAVARRGGSGTGGTVDGYVEVGSCVALTTREEVTEVPCDGPHDGTVVRTLAFDQPCPDGTAAHTSPDRLRRVCVQR